MDVKSYVKAARLRTLPLSISGIIVGSFLGLQDASSNILSKIAVSLDIETIAIYESPIFWLSILTINLLWLRGFCS